MENKQTPKFWYEKRKLLFEYGHTLLNSGISLGFHTLPKHPVKVMLKIQPLIYTLYIHYIYIYIYTHHTHTHINSTIKRTKFCRMQQHGWTWCAFLLSEMSNTEQMLYDITYVLTIKQYKKLKA